MAATLARAGWRLSRSTVRRRLKRPLGTPPQAPTHHTAGSVTARYPGHVWMADLTVVRGLFGVQTCHVAATLDVFSRFPLVAEAFPDAPTAAQIVSLFRSASRRLGPPRHFVSDRGVQFRSRAFRRAIERLGVSHRFGALGRSGSIALVERFWRTVKELLGIPIWRPLLREDLERRLASCLAYYCLHRPHSSLRGATPIEVYLGLTPAHDSAIAPPLAAARGAPPRAPFTIEFLDPERRLPILTRAA
jgi:transposase InsO family protein